MAGAPNCVCAMPADGNGNNPHGGGTNPVQWCQQIPSSYTSLPIGSGCNDGPQCASGFCDFSQYQKCQCADLGSRMLEAMAAFVGSQACHHPGECDFISVGSYQPGAGYIELPHGNSAFMFSDGTSVAPESTSLVTVGVLVPDYSVSSEVARGSEARPAVAAALEWIAEQPSLMNGYQFDAVTYNTNCSEGLGMLQYMSIQNRTPIAVLGDGCDTTTVAIQKVAESKKQLLLGWGASSPELYNANYYVSTSVSLRHYFAGFLQLCSELEVTFMAIVVDDSVHSGARDTFVDMVSERGFFSRASLKMRGTMTKDVNRVFDAVVGSASRAVIVVARDSGVEKLVCLV